MPQYASTMRGQRAFRDYLRQDVGKKIVQTCSVIAIQFGVVFARMIQGNNIMYRDHDIQYASNPA